jgi:hypothetical protein
MNIHLPCKLRLTGLDRYMLTDYISAVEGGATALTYCTPQSAGCSFRARDRLGDGFDIRGEQDFQSDSHGTLKRWARADATDQQRNGIFTYHFKTAWQPGHGSFATRVIWYSGSMNYQRRDETFFADGFVNVEDFYPNGSSGVTSRPMNTSEVRFVDMPLYEYMLMTLTSQQKQPATGSVNY